MEAKEKAKKIYEDFYYLMPPHLSDKDQDIVATMCAKKHLDLTIIQIGELDFLHAKEVNFLKEVKLEIMKL